MTNASEKKLEGNGGESLQNGPERRGRGNISSLFIS